ncbi:fibrosin-1-like protein [Sinocyclocheilus rhinocerous]|uniref:fibrosin-1-like protein n=1 Tax=Sinocyclocheilus rhinocerous TaxID=307959 RepID=UPI0007B85EDC|nr:PREDICTED: fibrosin-1-like protein [Sinocyclocheilus rhinocerous]
MEGKVKQSRRSRSQRERGRKREARAGEARDRSPSSGSERERSPGKNAPPRSTPSSRIPRPPRRKRRESSSQEEDIIDGFAIASFVSLDRLENKNVSVKLEKKKWEEIVVKRKKEAEENVTPDIDENGFGNLATSMGRDQERVKDRLLKNTYSKKSKRSLSLLNQAGRKMEETEVNAAPRSSSKDRLSESSTHSLSGRGYSVSDIFTLCGFTAELQYPLLPFMAPAADILIMLNREMVES